MKVEHLADVHLVDVVAAEDADVMRHGVADQVQVLEDGVRAALVPVLASALLRRDHVDVLVDDVGQVPAARDVAIERVGLVLSQDVDPVEPGVHQVRQHEVDDSISPAEGDRRLGAVQGQRSEAAALPTGEHHGHDIVGRHASSASVVSFGQGRGLGGIFRRRRSRPWRRQRSGRAP